VDIRHVVTHVFDNVSGFKHCFKDFRCDSETSDDALLLAAGDRFNCTIYRFLSKLARLMVTVSIVNQGIWSRRRTTRTTLTVAVNMSVFFSRMHAVRQKTMTLRNVALMP
jgi:hypothetical protein